MRWRTDKIFYTEICDLNKKFLQIFYEQKILSKTKIYWNLNNKEEERE